MKIIGLSGYARSGKDTVANILVRDGGLTRVAFADKVREALLLLDPYIPYTTEGKASEFFTLSQLVRWYGWEKLKSSAPQVRQLLQRMGTEVGRNLLDENVWVKAVISEFEPDGQYVISDCRFPNEADAIIAAGGSVVRIERLGFGPVNDHPSETALDDYDFDVWIFNKGTVAELTAEVHDFLIPKDK